MLGDQQKTNAGPRPLNSATRQAHFVIGLITITCFASFIRLYGIDAPPIWMDEAFTFLASSQSLRTIMFGQIDVHPPLFYAVEHLWLQIVPGTSLLRVPAAVAGVMTVVVVGLMVRDLVSRRAGLVAAALLTVSTLHTYMSQDARMYTLATLGIVIVVWGLIGSDRFDRNIRKYRMAYIAGAVIAIYSHAIGLICLASINATYVIYCVTRHDPVKRYLGWFSMNLVVLILVLPWLLMLGTASVTFGGEKHYDISVLPWFYRNAVGFPGLPEIWRRAGDILMLITIAAGMLQAWRANRRAIFFVIGGVLITYPALLGFLNIFKAVFVNRVFLPCSITAAVMAAIAIESSLPKVRSWVWGVAIICLGAASTWIEVHHRVKNEDVPQALAIASRAGFGNAPVITDSIWTAGTMRVVAPGKSTYLESSDKLFEIGQGFDQLSSHPIAQVFAMDTAQMDSAIRGGGGGGWSIDPNSPSRPKTKSSS